MYVKLIGLGCLFTFSILYSRNITGKMKERLKELEEINKTLKDFIISINTGMYDVMTLIDNGINLTNTKYNLFLKRVKARIEKKAKDDFFDIWFNCIEKTDFNLSLEEKILLENIGAALSFTDKDRIVNQLKLIENSYKVKIEEVRRENDMKISLYEKMGVLFGGFLVIIFI